MEVGTHLLPTNADRQDATPATRWNEHEYPPPPPPLVRKYLCLRGLVVLIQWGTPPLGHPPPPGGGGWGLIQLVARPSCKGTSEQSTKNREMLRDAYLASHLYETQS